jgi:hypothetical protein
LTAVEITETFDEVFKRIRNFVIVKEPVVKEPKAEKKSEKYRTDGTVREGEISNVFTELAEHDVIVRDMLHLHKYGIHVPAVAQCAPSRQKLVPNVVTLYQYLNNLVHCIKKNGNSACTKTVAAKNTILSERVKPLLADFYEEHTYPYSAEDILVFENDARGLFFKDKGGKGFGALAISDCHLFNLYVKKSKKKIIGNG